MDSNKTFNISMPKALLDAIDKQAESEYRNRSDLIWEAVRTYILQKGGMNTTVNLTSTEESRIKDNLNFSNFAAEPVILLSCSYRPQPNAITDIFAAGSKVMELVEKPPKLRNMGWDLDTLDRARPVAGEYLEVANGKRKLLRLYRDGQSVFSAGMNFFGHGVNEKLRSAKNVNLLSVAEFITNYVTFSQLASDSLERHSDTMIFTIAVSNPEAAPKHTGKNVLGIQAYDGHGVEKVGELDLEWAERNIVIRTSDDITPERIVYLIYAEFCYFFGVRSDEFWYVNKEKQEINKNEFLRAGA